MRRFRHQALAAAVGCATLAVAAPATAAPAPGDRTETPVASSAPDRRIVAETFVRQYEPLPAELHAPAECDWLGYLRFRHVDGPADPSAADAVLVAMPGNLGGAANFDALARNVVRAAAARARYVEVWALDRRSNCLEDHTGVAAAARAHDPRVAIDYYWGDKEVDGRRFDGFKTSEEMPYLSEFGVARTVEDEYAVITRGIPDPEVRRRKVLCGGHSYGGWLTGAFASWDFDGDPKTTEDAGYNHCAAYFALDTDVDNNIGQSTQLAPVASALVAATEPALRSGALSRNIESVPPSPTPETATLIGLLGLLAYERPDAPAPFDLVPRTRDIDLTLREYFSRNAAVFAAGTPTMRDFRMTNEAALGAFADDNTQGYVSALAASFGTYGGGPIVDKDFPAPDAPKDVPLLGYGLPGLPGLLGSQGVLGFLAGTTALPVAQPQMIPETPHGPLYRWCNYDEVGGEDCPIQRRASGRPYTATASEVTDIHEFARSLYEAPADVLEHYMPTRIFIDALAYQFGARNGELAPAIHEDGPNRRPLIEILAAEGAGGLLPTFPPEAGAQPRRRVVLPGYNHVDVVTAAARQNDGSQEASSTSLAEFAIDVAGAPPRAALSISVAPRRVRVGHTVRLRVHVTSPSAACARGAVVRIAGRRVRADRRGRATLRLRFRRTGLYVATARKRGCLEGSATIRVRRA